MVSRRAFSGVFCRPFKISKDEAIDIFQFWKQEFLPSDEFPLKQESPPSITPILVPFYGCSVSNRICYAGAPGYPLSDLIVHSLQTNPALWIHFDDTLLDIENLSVFSRWTSLEAGQRKLNSLSSSSIRKAYLPGYEVKFTYFKGVEKYVFIGGESGNVCGIKEPKPVDVVRKMLPKDKLCKQLVLPFIVIPVIMYSLMRVYFSSRIVHAISIRTNRFDALFQSEFGECKSPLDRIHWKRDNQEDVAKNHRFKRILIDSWQETEARAKDTLGLPHSFTKEELHSAFLVQFQKCHNLGSLPSRQVQQRLTLRAFTILSDHQSFKKSKPRESINNK